jgi:hypothetical protein
MTLLIPVTGPAVDVSVVFLLLGGAITILKNDGVRQWAWDDIPYMTWKIIQMFETTNQFMMVYSDFTNMGIFK